MKHRPLFSASSRRSWSALTQSLMLALAIAIGFWVAGPSGGLRAAESNETKAPGALDPRQMLAECRAKETMQRRNLDTFRAHETEVRRLFERQRDLDSLIPPLRGKVEAFDRLRLSRAHIVKRYTAQIHKLEEQCRRKSNGTMDAEKYESCRRYSLVKSVAEPDIKFMQEYEKKHEDSIEKLKKLKNEQTDTRGRLIKLLKDARLPSLWINYETINEYESRLEEGPKNTSERCRVLERLAKLTEGLLREQKPAEKTKQEEKRKEPAQPPEIEKAPSETAAEKRDRQARADIKAAKSYFDEAKALILDGRPAEARKSYRVAASLLAEARANTDSARRRDKIDENITSINKRVTDLPKPSEQKAPADHSAAAAQRKAQCQSQYGSNASVLKVDKDGTFWCQCKTGFALNEQKQCVKRDRRTLARAACSNQYRNSVFVGFKNGQPQCNCPKGRRWNSARTACVKAPKTVRRQPHRTQQGLDARTARALYTLGAMIGQALRSRHGAGGHVTHGQTPPPSAGQKSTGGWKEHFGKYPPMTRPDSRMFGTGAGPR